jgi:hypothetical protein
LDLRVRIETFRSLRDISRSKRIDSREASARAEGRNQTDLTTRIAKIGRFKDPRRCVGSLPNGTAKGAKESGAK